MNQPNNIPLIGLISSKNPARALEATVSSLFKGGASRVIVVDDGSESLDSLPIFDRIEQAGAEVIHLKNNVGKSKALRAGFLILPKQCIIVQTDDDTLAGDLTGPAHLIQEGKADIVDIRIEAMRTKSLLGLVQELDYWMINAVVKRLQNFFDARLWMSGASVMYSHDAAEQLILPVSHSMTEDTEGLFRARSKGFRVKYYAKHEAQFRTMVPEDLLSLHKQWRRWATGNGQVMSIYGFGGGNLRIAIVNVVSWIDLVVVPVPVVIRFGIIPCMLWAFAAGILMGVIGSIRLKRPLVALAGVFFPFISILWTFHALQGLYLAYRLSKSGETVLTWVSPKRTLMEVEPY
jgi:cellulose synthase/poly-beta-1,6-N-acetylglucosamine synthase-like glycosyltransferase